MLWIPILTLEQTSVFPAHNSDEACAGISKGLEPVDLGI